MESRELVRIALDALPEMRDNGFVIAGAEAGPG